MVERCPKPVMKAAPPESPGKTPGLHRSLGLGEVTASGVGIIIGAGIYVLLGAATAHAGATVWLAFVLAAVLSALTGLSYAELASMYPSAAAEYEYTRQALPEWIAFVVGWVMVAGLVVAAATSHSASRATRDISSTSASVRRRSHSSRDWPSSR